MKFTKMQGAGNDYLYIDARHIEQDWERLAIDMSNRHFGVGSDGIILIQNSSIADLKMRMFNADGSEGEMCGNGIRCLIKYIVDKNINSINQIKDHLKQIDGVMIGRSIYHSPYFLADIEKEIYLTKNI